MQDAVAARAKAFQILELRLVIGRHIGNVNAIVMDLYAGLARRVADPAEPVSRRDAFATGHRN